MRRKDTVEAVKSLIEWAVETKRKLPQLDGSTVLDAALSELDKFPSRITIRRDGEGSLILDARGMSFRIEIRSV